MTSKRSRLAPRLQKTTTLLYRTGPESLTYAPDERGDEPPAHLLQVDPEVLKELGNPEVLTVVIARGDLLNREPTEILMEQLRRNESNEKPAPATR